MSETDSIITFSVSRSLLSFHKTTEGRPFYHIAFNITNNKFSDSFEWVNSKLDVLEAGHGLPIATLPDWNAQSFYFYDNNGSILEFMVRFDLPYYSADPFSVADIKEISEAGIVSDDVLATAAMLHSKYAIPYFRKDKPSEDFAVLGDDRGALVIIKTGRGWRPVNKQADVYPMTVIADGIRLEI